MDRLRELVFLNSMGRTDVVKWKGEKADVMEIWTRLHDYTQGVIGELFWDIQETEPAECCVNID